MTAIVPAESAVARGTGGPLARGELLVDLTAIAATHALLCVAVRALGFDHVSDDDFARVTIAQAFAHAPKLDPSGTSWLPFPFWILGGLMTAFGRSLAAARALSIGLSSLAAVAPYAALRTAGVARGRALAASALAFGTPWALWLGASTVPESFTASLTVASAIGLSAPGARRSSTWAFALAIAAASLSRYEPWPVAAVLAAALGARALGPMGAAGSRRAWLIAAVICALGPLAWMAWNAHAHDGPLHFFRRVANYKRAIGDGASDTVTALLLYPRLLLTTRPEVTIPVVLLLPAAVRDRALTRRWAVPLLAAAAQIVFLAYGNARDGAPAHHPERALLGPLLLLACFVADVGMSRGSERSAHAPTRAKLLVGAVTLLWVGSIVRGAEMPGRTTSEDRHEQIARGALLRAEGVDRIVVAPCAFEHFALLAAYGAPEKALLEPPARPAPGEACPRVERR